MKARSGLLDELNTRFLPLSADPPATLLKLREELELPFQLLSDPSLKVAEKWQVRTSSHHPMARTYPEKQFLQPAVIILRPDGGQAFLWRIRPKLSNLFGAAKRMTPDEVLSKLKTLAKN